MRPELCVFGDCSLLEAIKRLDDGGYGVLFVLDKGDKMIGILTDGDVRKAILNGIELSSPLSHVMNQHFAFGTPDQTREAHINYLRKIQRRHLPILDKQGRLADVLILAEVEFQRDETPVVIMAGGLGSRLAPLTDHCPKPMFRVGDKPILEHILNNFIQHGFYRFFISVNYKAETIEDYFRDGSKLGVDINYVHEPMRMGTAGALSLLADQLHQPFITINGDVLTKVDPKHLLHFHKDHHWIATMGVRKYDIQVPFGVVEHKECSITRIVEKPVHEFYVNAGIYVLDPKCLPYIPKQNYFDMTDLFGKLIADKREAGAFLVMEHWVDVGRIDDLERANTELAQQIKEI